MPRTHLPNLWLLLVIIIIIIIIQPGTEVLPVWKCESSEALIIHKFSFFMFQVDIQKLLKQNEFLEQTIQVSSNSSFYNLFSVFFPFFDVFFTAWYPNCTCQTLTVGTWPVSKAQRYRHECSAQVCKYDLVYSVASSSLLT